MNDSQILICAKSPYIRSILRIILNAAAFTIYLCKINDIFLMILYLCAMEIDKAYSVAYSSTQYLSSFKYVNVRYPFLWKQKELTKRESELWPCRLVITFSIFKLKLDCWHWEDDQHFTKCTSLRRTPQMPSITRKWRTDENSRP